MRHNGSDPDDLRQILAEQDIFGGLTRGGCVLDELRALIPNYEPSPRTLSEAEAAQWLGLKPKALAARRRRGTGPVVHEVREGSARYTVSALGAWLEATRRRA